MFRHYGVQRSGGRAARGAMAVLGMLAMCGAIASSAAAEPVRVTRAWHPGFIAPETPESLDTVGVVKVMPWSRAAAAAATNVLVLEPGTSAGAPYFLPFAKWLVENVKGWQVWSVERRENRLENQSRLNMAKKGAITPRELFEYYLGYLTNGGKLPHVQPVSEQHAIADGARQWGMNVAVQDLHVVIEEAKALGGKVVLGGHSLGGSVVTAYATWDFGGKAGADGLAGLVYDDGGSSPTPVTAEQAGASLETLSKKTPWLAFGGIPAPTLGLFGSIGASLALMAPGEAAVLGNWIGLPPSLQTHNAKGEVVPATNEAGFGYGVNVGTSPPNLFAAQVHAGAGLAEPETAGQPWTWNGAGAITPIRRYAEMLAGSTLMGADGNEWYFPERLTIDTGAVAEGNDNPAQAVLGEHAIHGHELPTSLRILAIGTELGKEAVLKAAEILAEQSGIPHGNLTLINEENTYAHNDPAGAYPNNEFFSQLVPFLSGL